jgi:hypothetical protein
MDNEKKFKLDELPDSGSEPDKIEIPTIVKSKPEPRIENLKQLTDAERVDAIGQLWRFDRSKIKWGWLFFLIALFAFEKSGVLARYHAKKIHIEKESDRIGALIFDHAEVEFVMKHPLLLALLIPFLFKFKTSANDYFEITFNGLNAVKTIDVPKFQIPLRVKVKWNDIKEVKKIVVKDRSVIELYNLEGPVAQLIWDIDDMKKKVVKRVLMSLISPKHPMRILIEKDVA